MSFIGRALLLSDQDILDTAASLGCEPAVIKAVAEVESSGSGFLRDKRPTILFEAHVFGRFTVHRWDRTHPHISTPKWDRLLYGKAGAYQYERLEEAMSLSKDAALMSASWGRFQIMGFNHKLVGFADVESFVAAMCESEGKQLVAFGKFCRSKKLVQALIDHDWPKFARGYNGAGYAENQYDIKLATAYEKHKALSPLGVLPGDKPWQPGSGKDEQGNVEDEVVTRYRVATMNLQEFLRDTGFYRGRIDGDFGGASRLALSLYLGSK